MSLKGIADIGNPPPCPALFQALPTEQDVLVYQFVERGLQAFKLSRVRL